MSGFDVLRSLRASKVKAPILILTGLAAIEDKVRGLGFGADDYLTKPFHKDELVARIQALVRRSRGHAQSAIEVDDLRIDLDTKGVEVGGARVHLTGKEYKILELLALRKDATLTKESFVNHLYGGMDEPRPRLSTCLSASCEESLRRIGRQGLHRNGMGTRLYTARAKRG